MLFGSFCFQVGQTGTLRLPERVPLPSIRPASWVPPIDALRMLTLMEDLDDSSSCNSDLCDPPSDEGTYGSGYESCGSSDPLCKRYLCAVIHGGNINNGSDPPLGENPNPPPNPPPNPQVENVGNRVNPPNTAARATEGIN